jgi:hypothetical protein
MKETENAGTTFSTLEKLDDTTPSADWTVEQLGQYAHLHDKQYSLCGRKMAIHRFKEGWALTLAYEKVLKEKGYGHWGKFLKEHGISPASDNRARELYKKAEREENLRGLTIQEAYERFGIEKPKAAANAGKKKVAPKQASEDIGPTNEPDVQESEDSNSTVQPEVQKPENSQAAPTTENTGAAKKLREPAGVQPKSTSASARRNLEKAFDEMAEEKGWDQDRRVQVMAVLWGGEPWDEMANDLVDLGMTDEVIRQLHVYHDDEPDYLETLLTKVVAVVEERADEGTSNVLAEIDNAIARLTQIRSAVLILTEEGVAA